MRRAAVVLAASESTARDLAPLPPRYRRPLGVGAEFSPGDGPRTHLLHIASDDPRDNSEVVIDAYAAYGDDRPPLVVAGPIAAARPALEERARAAGVADSIRWAGFQSDRGPRRPLPRRDRLRRPVALRGVRAPGGGGARLRHAGDRLEHDLAARGGRRRRHPARPARRGGVRRGDAARGRGRGVGRRPAGEGARPGRAASPGSTRRASSSPRARGPCDELARALRSRRRRARPPRPGTRVRRARSRSGSRRSGSWSC